jgi:hypothetical protein
MPRGHSPYVPESKFAPLVAFVATQGGDNLTLTYTEIERIIGMPLSITAQVGHSIWSSPTQRFVQDLAAIGWRAHLQVHDRAVEFRRIPVMSDSPER